MKNKKPTIKQLELDLKSLKSILADRKNDVHDLLKRNRTVNTQLLYALNHRDELLKDQRNLFISGLALGATIITIISIVLVYL